MDDAVNNTLATSTKQTEAITAHSSELRSHVATLCMFVIDIILSYSPHFSHYLFDMAHKVYKCFFLNLLVKVLRSVNGVFP